VILPPELKQDPLARLAQLKASEEHLAAIDEKIVVWDGRLTAVKRIAIVGALVVLVCVLLGVMYSSKLINDASIKLSHATHEQELQQNAELSARQHTFGAHFDSTVNGWFIDFPKGTAFRIMTFRGLPAIQILPHGR
jgi:hypothetical protein